MAEVFVGVDVSKDTLDVAIWPGAEGWRVANSEHDLHVLIERLELLAPELVVLEASGQLHRPVAEALTTAGFRCAVMNPRQVRDFAKATGKLSKTDKLDARVLARFAATVRPIPRNLPDAATQRLEALVARRRQLMSMVSSERNRRRTSPPDLREQINEHIMWLQERIGEPTVLTRVVR